MLRILTLVILGQVPIFASSEANSPSFTEHPNLDTLSALIIEGLAHNPGIKAAELEVAALHSSPNQQWFLSPPEIGIDFFQTPLSSFPNPLHQQQEIDYSIRQTFPFPGKISKRKEAEHQHAEMGASELLLKKNSLSLTLKTLYYGGYLLDRQIEINQENRNILEQQLEILRKQYEVGIGRQVDLLRIQSELTKLKLSHLKLNQARSSIDLEFTSLLNRKEVKKITVATKIVPIQLTFTLEQLPNLIEKNHPSLRLNQRAINMLIAEQAMNRKDLYPDFTIGGAYKNGLNNSAPPSSSGDENFWSLNATMTLPFAFWSSPKYTTGNKQIETQIMAAKQAGMETKNQLVFKAKNAFVNTENQKNQLQIINAQLLPQAAQTLASSEIAYRAGKADLKDLLEAYQLQFSIRENQEMNLTELLINQAELEYALGVDLVSLQGMQP